MATSSIEKILAKFRSDFPYTYDQVSEDNMNETHETFLRHALTQAHQAGIDKTGKKAVTLFQQALGDTELPEKVWEKIAKVNQILLDK